MFAGEDGGWEAALAAALGAGREAEASVVPATCLPSPSDQTAGSARAPPAARHGRCRRQRQARTAPQGRKAEGSFAPFVPK